VPDASASKASSDSPQSLLQMSLYYTVLFFNIQNLLTCLIIFGGYWLVKKSNASGSSSKSNAPELNQYEPGRIITHRGRAPSRERESSTNVKQQSAPTQQSDDKSTNSTQVEENDTQTYLPSFNEFTTKGKEYSEISASLLAKNLEDGPVPRTTIILRLQKLYQLCEVKYNSKKKYHTDNWEVKTQKLLVNKLFEQFKQNSDFILILQKITGDSGQ
jgi:hypothetical protein